MNLLYEDVANQSNLDTYTTQIDNPKISFEDYIKSFNPNPKEQISYNVGISKCNKVECEAIDDDDIIMDTIADSGADVDVISGRKKDSYTNITKLVNTTLNGIGGPSRVHESADHAHLEGLHTDQGIINDSSNMSCLSISQRAAKGFFGHRVGWHS